MAESIPSVIPADSRYDMVYISRRFPQEDNNIFVHADRAYVRFCLKRSDTMPEQSVTRFIRRGHKA